MSKTDAIDRGGAVPGGRRTKIVCTLGPASETPEVLAAMLEAGMDVARFNVSHGSHADHQRRLQVLRQAQDTTDRRVAILWDLRGPEVRLLLPDDEPLTVEPGDEMMLPDTTWAGLPDALQGEGQRILLADAAVVAVTIAPPPGRDGDRPWLRFQSAGVLRQRSKVAVPGLRPDLPSLSDQDLADIAYGVELGADIFAMSFVHEARDLLELRDRLRALGSDAATIAKIETQAAFTNLGAILSVCDGAMVARGDLGVECAFEEIPLMQKEILGVCNRIGKPGITATEMLESMIQRPRPTRAEASDVFNAVLDGTDALMLSGETAVGSYPAEAVAVMHRIAVEAERAWSARRRQSGPPAPELGDGDSPSAVAIAGAAVWAADTMRASAIITPTRSGFTARMVSRLRPPTPIIAVSPDQRTVDILRLSWGVTPLHNPAAQTGSDSVETSLDAAGAAGLIGSGDLVVITAGVPSGVPGTTNMLQLRTIGEVLARGTGIAAGSAVGAAVGVTGPLCVVTPPAQPPASFQEGCVLVAPYTDADTVPFMKQAAAVITEEAGLSSHAALVCLSLGKPVVLGVAEAVSLPDGETVTVDARRGVVYRGRVRPV